jgi:hypothetical protein
LTDHAAKTTARIVWPQIYLSSSSKCRRRGGQNCWMARSSLQQIPSWVPRRQERARAVSFVNAAVVHGGEAFRIAQSGGQAVAGEELTVQPVDTGETGNGEAKARVPFLGTARARVAKALRPSTSPVSPNGCRSTPGISTARIGGVEVRAFAADRRR